MRYVKRDVLYFKKVERNGDRIEKGKKRRKVGRVKILKAQRASLYHVGDPNAVHFHISLRSSGRSGSSI